MPFSWSGLIGSLDSIVCDLSLKDEVIDAIAVLNLRDGVLSTIVAVLNSNDGVLILKVAAYISKF